MNPGIRTKASGERPPSIVVAGDVCIDWLSVPIEPAVPDSALGARLNWQLRGGRHMYAVRGGGWLTADLVEAAVGGIARVAKPKAIDHLESVPPERIIHSMLALEPGPRKRGDKTAEHWVVGGFEGFAGPPYDKRPEVLPTYEDDPRADLVVLDDAGNGFRDSVQCFPLALTNGKPWVLHKVRRPLGHSALWKLLEAKHIDRTITLLSVDELRGEGASISRRLSWERTATDLALSFARDPKFTGLRQCPFLVVPLGIEGAVLLGCKHGLVASAHLWYLPRSTEGERLERRGSMSGFGSVFAAALAGTLVRAGHPAAITSDALETILHKGMSVAFAAAKKLMDEAFGPCRTSQRGSSSAGAAGEPIRPAQRTPAYPVDSDLFEENAADTDIHDVRLPDLPPGNDAAKTSTFRAWRILDSLRTRSLEELATDVVLRGAGPVLDGMPVGQFGKLATFDRSEIESYRTIRNLIQEFCRNPKPERPLCLAVFGPPGGGKSFGVTQVALGVEVEASIEPMTFNVSQWESPSFLIQALHCVRDHALRGRIPLVFFDEFDSEIEGRPLAWLKFFLEPMQDGVFMDGLHAHQIGKAIFVFAGGTAHSYAEFRRKVDEAANEANSLRTPIADGRAPGMPSARSAKQPDFLSRLRGHVDVFGVNPPVNTNLLRRALILRANLCKKHAALLDATGGLRIDDGVLRAFLGAPKYLHGARSIEAILEMSQLHGRPHFDPSLLPPEHQLDLHVGGTEFMALVKSQHALGAKLDEIARVIHDLYVEQEIKKGAKLNSRPALRQWDELDPLYRNSNREQAAHYPRLLAAAGCRIVDGGPADPALTEEEVDQLARLEHERWYEERRIRQPDHPDLVPWDQLPPEEKEKDIRSVQTIPLILGKVGLGARRMEDGLYGSGSFHDIASGGRGSVIPRPPSPTPAPIE